ncbi:primosomal protein DnaI [Edaphobacillus lindanitolerans]|uniref:Primosomal protein DnaI n=1 Tax=Edaphobacillus lindanitolerans TaxID=550447 RepID=A0A1U7PQX1_9BACI|nr:primosomal protein DnaI [Edaphobacillus lindanitolerans]SIT84828.1 primosomal protein DnaI [Edaphobacillus lindanitolerans]
MEPIRETLKRVVNAPAFAERYDTIRNEVLENPGVQAFLEEHSGEVSKGMVERGMGKLYEYVNQSHDCSGCPNLEGCINVVKGYEPKLAIERGTIGVDYVMCRRKVVDTEHRKVSSMIRSMHMPKDMLGLEIKDVDLTSEETRLAAVEKIGEFLDQYDRTGELPSRGLFIHGPFGTGKSYLLGAVAGELAKRHVPSVLVFVPEFLRELKQAIQDQSLDEKISFVKQAPVLMLDDLGAETLTAWTRDEVLATILHYRMSEQLPTFFTSNFDYKGLENHLAYTQRGDKEVVKAGRIMERIRSMTTPVRLDGPNRREKQ